MLVFQRRNFTELWIKIQSNEVLGILDSDYIEDYYGIDGQLTLYRIDTEERTPVMMNEVTDETVSIPHDVFTGFIDLTTTPNGEYRLEGRIRDLLGNYRVLSEVETPYGTEDVTDFVIRISSMEIVVEYPGLISVQLGSTFGTPLVLTGLFTGLKVQSLLTDLEIEDAKVFSAGFQGDSVLASNITKTGVFNLNG